MERFILSLKMKDPASLESMLAKVRAICRAALRGAAQAAKGCGEISAVVGTTGFTARSMVLGAIAGMRRLPFSLRGSSRCPDGKRVVSTPDHLSEETDPGPAAQTVSGENVGLSLCAAHQSVNNQRNLPRTPSELGDHRILAALVFRRVRAIALPTKQPPDPLSHKSSPSRTNGVGQEARPNSTLGLRPPPLPNREFSDTTSVEQPLPTLLAELARRRVLALASKENSHDHGKNPEYPLGAGGLRLRAAINVELNPQISISRYQSLLLRARREASSISTIPTLPSPTSETKR